MLNKILQSFSLVVLFSLSSLAFSGSYTISAESYGFENNTNSGSVYIPPGTTVNVSIEPSCNANTSAGEQCFAFGWISGAGNYAQGLEVAMPPNSHTGTGNVYQTVVSAGNGNFLVVAETYAYLGAYAQVRITLDW